MEQPQTVAAITNLMEHFEVLTEENFLSFCKKYYFNSECSGKNEFIDDLKRIKYIKRLIQKIHKHKTLKSIRERLILNHLIVFKNDPYLETICYFKVHFASIHLAKIVDYLFS